MNYYYRFGKDMLDYNILTFQEKMNEPVDIEQIRLMLEVARFYQK